jgi:hypothetical protein
MRVVGVVVIHVLVDSHEVTPPENQHPVKTLATDRSHETFRDGDGSRCSDRGSGHAHSFGKEDFIEAGREVGISVSNEPPHRDRSLRQHPRELTGLLSHPGAGRAGVTPATLTFRESFSMKKST